MLLLKTLLFTVFVPGTVAVLVPWLLARHREIAHLPLGSARVLGWVLALVGAAGYLWCAWDFINTGRGTPAPIDAPRKLVVRGLYRHSRNPMYVSVLLVIFGHALALQSVVVLVYGLALWAVFHAFVRLYEEPRLAREFQLDYDRYRHGVPRWLGKPRLRRPSSG